MQIIVVFLSTIPLPVLRKALSNAKLDSAFLVIFGFKTAAIRDRATETESTGISVRF